MLIITEYQQARVLSPLPRGSADGPGVPQQGAPALRRSPDREDLAAAQVARRRGHSRVRPPGHGGAAPLRGGPSGIQSRGASPREDIPIAVKWTARPRPGDARHLET